MYYWGGIMLINFINNNLIKMTMNKRKLVELTSDEKKAVDYAFE